MTSGAYLAVFDVLGFTELMQQSVPVVREKLKHLSDACKIASLDLKDLKQHLDSQGRREKDVVYPFDTTNVPRRAEYLQVSDTILVRPIPGSLDPLGDLVKVCVGLLQIGIIMGVRMRGAIVKGSYEWQASPPIVFGPAVARAMMLEHQQDWFGALLDSESIPEAEIHAAKLVENELVIRYKVPMKDGPANHQLALSWPRRLISDFSDQLEPQANEWAVLRKELNAKAFYDHVRSLFPLTRKPPAL